MMVHGIGLHEELLFSSQAFSLHFDIITSALMRKCMKEAPRRVSDHTLCRVPVVGYDWVVPSR